MKYLLILLIGIIIGIDLNQTTTIYRMSCNTDKYGWMWGSQKRFDKEGHTCKGNEKQQVQREYNLYMIYQVVKLELFK